jgi:YidC/Oxa1 family membrane protein insertase
VNVNKFFIEFIDANLENTLGTDAGGFGFSLILYTCLIKTLLYPLYEGQLRATARMRKVQPVMREIQRRYAGNQERINKEMTRMYIEE